jgi:MoxR-like ATPase
MNDLGERELPRVLGALNAIIFGKEDRLKLALACLLARGHLLIEDQPGVGKTTLALALASVLGLEFRRIQFTSDLLPADVVGVSVYDPDNRSFRFHPGPIFSQLVLADEVNRASPKTQSSLLEAMEERHVTVDGRTHALPEPFFVIATQNPLEQIGTYPLPESQLDRFLMRLSLGYPSAQAERHLLTEPERREVLATTAAVLTPARLVGLQAAAGRVHTAPALIDYLLALITATREHPRLKHGLSPRAGLALRRAAQAWALLHDRRGVVPEDVQAVFLAVAGHRLVAVDDVERVDSIAAKLLATVPIP